MKSKNIIRMMPNTPALVNQGISVWWMMNPQDQNMRSFCKETFSLIGKEIEVNDEDFINKATAIFGAGPAYVALFTESFVGKCHI